MRRILRSAALFFALLPTTMVQAQDARWTGPYIGAHVGGGWGRLADGDTSIKLNGVLGGGHAGYNFQNGNIVYGVEGDFTWSGADGSQSTDQGGCVIIQRVCVPLASSTDVSAHLHWLASVRARLGFTVGNALIYGTGGFAWARTDLSVVANGVGGGAWGGNGTHTGYAAGGGVELKLAPNVSARAEVLHYGLGSASFWVNGGNLPLDLDVTTARVGLTFHFN